MGERRDGMMHITDEARDLLDELLHDLEAGCVRVYFSGYEQGEPQLGLALADPHADDELLNLNSIPTAIDRRILHLTEDVVLEGKSSIEGPKFKLIRP
ncbi:hypothetical protein [Thalassobacillus hwangdonensis]|uniref:Uncharacterized protein n=1 Tax=Thalassobacillus hwangdonensis TaxID=546108 RepID=A0ABW3L3W8_9BACI